MSTDLARPDDGGFGFGFEDIDQRDMAMPRLQIDHTEGVYRDSLTGETFASVDSIILGLIKGRTCWEPEISEEKKGPLCRSYDFEQGYPDGKRFPWAAAKFDPNQWVEGTSLPCDACALKDWGSHPKTEGSWCTEQYNLAVMLPAGEDWAPAVLTVQRSGLKSTRAYISGFARSRQPMFTAVTRLGLQQNKRGSVKYAVPTFTKSAATDAGDWDEFKETYFRVREFLRTPRGVAVEEPMASGSRSAAASDDDDLDFDS